ncbi:MAG: relaxase domain-containing protein, partial [Actinobacteria bacterium]|nr:relaxase domain-containing protein [Actinomycetota bacterium]
MTLGSWRYYDHEVGVEDYYVDGAEEAGTWVGSGAEALGLSGVVQEGQLARLFDEGSHPVSGEALGAIYRHDAKGTVVTGYALSFSPPKSVSLVAAFAGRAVAEQVGEAHAAAVHAALAFFEEHASFSRAGRAGILQVDTAGYLAAAFIHQTSRAGDPQVHAHVLLANKVLCADGRWRSLDGRELFAFQKAAGLLYNATLRVELRNRLGVGWEPVDANGQADIRGVPRGLIEMFSKRSHDVERLAVERIAALEARLGRAVTGDERAEQRQRATYDTRPAKAAYEDEATRGGRWRTEADRAGFDPTDWLSRTLDQEHSVSWVLEPVAEPTVVDEIVFELANARSAWGRAEVAKATARRLPVDLAAGAEAGRAWIAATSAAVLANPEVVTLASPLSADVPGGLRRIDGMAQHDRHGAPRHTTRTTLVREGRILDLVVQGRDAGVAVCGDRNVHQAIRAYRLGVDQAGALRRVCGGGERIVCVVGPAGSGKTTMLAAAADAWCSAGIRVRGVAVSAIAAGVLAEETGLPAETIAKFLHDGRRGGDPRLGLRAGDVVVVDEAAMVATVDLAALAEAVGIAGAKLVLVGDHRQLGAVEAGGLFRLLVADSHSVELDQPRRFRSPWEAAATLRLRNGDESVLDDYDARRRIRGGTRSEMLDDAMATWRAARAAGESVVVVTADHATVDALAMRARAERVATGEVEPHGLQVGAQIVGHGDEIVTLRNDRRIITSGGLWVRNGDRWRVDARRDDGALVVSHLDGHGRVVLPAEYSGEQVALGYAVTVHKAQGITVDRAVLVADSATSAEHLYVGMTRGRFENRACVITEGAGTGHGQHPPVDAVAVLRAV